MKSTLPGKIAIVHDWFESYAGSERVVEQMLACFPEADLFGLVDFLPPGQRGFILDKVVTTSYVQRLPFSRKKFRRYLPLMPIAVEQFDMASYDLVISSNHAVAKGVITGPNQLHLCMCYSPIRYAWDLQHQYIRESGLDSGVKGWLAKWLLHRIRLWDLRTSNGVDHFIAISGFIARRIWKVYRRDATVIYPPVNLASFPCVTDKQDFYFTASRMVPYKRLDLIVEAFAQMPDRRLVVIGDGDEMPKVRAKAGANVLLLGYQPTAVLRDHLQRARAFIFAAEEDFGIAPLEAQACGTPVIAFAKGGSLETIEGLESSTPTGVFFQQQSADAIAAAVRLFESNADKISANACRKNAERFSIERFRAEFNEFVRSRWHHFERQLPAAAGRPGVSEGLPT